MSSRSLLSPPLTSLQIHQLTDRWLKNLSTLSVTWIPVFTSITTNYSSTLKRQTGNSPKKNSVFNNPFFIGFQKTRGKGLLYINCSTMWLVFFISCWATVILWIFKLISKLNRLAFGRCYLILFGGKSMGETGETLSSLCYLTSFIKFSWYFKYI